MRTVSGATSRRATLIALLVLAAMAGCGEENGHPLSESGSALLKGGRAFFTAEQGQVVSIVIIDREATRSTGSEGKNVSIVDPDGAALNVVVSADEMININGQKFDLSRGRVILCNLSVGKVVCRQLSDDVELPKGPDFHASIRAFSTTNPDVIQFLNPDLLE